MKKKKLVAIYTDWGGRRGLIGGCGYYRIVQPMRYMSDFYDVHTYGRIIYNFETYSEFEEKFNDADIVLIKNTNNETWENLVELRKKYGFKIISDFDDDFLSVHPLSPFYKDYHKGTKGYKDIEMQLKESDGLIVTTQHLKKTYSKYNNKIEVVPNMIDVDDWDYHPEPKHNERILIGWSGSSTHEPDLMLIADVLKEIMIKNKNVDLGLCNYLPDAFKDLDKSRIRIFNGTKSYVQYPRYLTMMNLDIGLAPLKDMQFNYCKSNIKWMEYALAGVPTVASPVQPYKCITNGVDGLLSKNTKEWIDNIQSLIDDRKKRQKLVRGALKKIQTDYDIKTNGKTLWYKAIENIIS